MSRILAQYLFQKSEFYSPWFWRRGDNLIFTADVAAVFQGELTVRVYHKDPEDTGDGALTGAPLTISAVGREGSRALGLLPLVRYKFVCESTGGGSATTLDRVLFRMLTPVWYSKV